MAVCLCVIVLGLCAGPAVVLSQAAQADADPSDLALVVFPPWRDADAALRNAGWRLVGPDQPPLARLALPDADGGAIDTAWIVLRNPALIALCTTKGVP